MTTSISKSALVDQIANEQGLTKAEAQKHVDNVLRAISGHLSTGNEVRLSGFGTFAISERKATTGRNPATGASLEIPASKSVRFKPAKDLKDQL